MCAFTMSNRVWRNHEFHLLKAAKVAGFPWFWKILQNHVACIQFHCIESHLRLKEKETQVVYTAMVGWLLLYEEHKMKHKMTDRPRPRAGRLLTVGSLCSLPPSLRVGGLFLPCLQGQVCRGRGGAAAATGHQHFHRTGPRHHRARHPASAVLLLVTILCLEIGKFLRWPLLECSPACPGHGTRLVI